VAEIAGTLCIHEGKLLVLQRKGAGEPNDLPKGRVEPKETPREAALRETREETGLTPILRDPAVSLQHQGDTYHVFAARAGSRDVRLSSEHTDYRWVSATEASSMLYAPLARIVEMIVGKSKVPERSSLGLNESIARPRKTLLAEELSQRELDALDIMSERRGFDDEFWMEHRRRVQSGEFSPEFERWMNEQGYSESDRQRAWFHYLREERKRLDARRDRSLDALSARTGDMQKQKGPRGAPLIRDDLKQKVSEMGLQSEERETNPDGSISCGVFIPLPYSLAKDFPDKSHEDDSPPHFTILYVGDCSPSDFQKLVKCVCEVSEKLKPFSLDLSHYGEFLNHKKQKIAHMGPGVINRSRLAVIHSLLKRACEQAGVKVDHNYGPMDDPRIPDVVKFKAHATLQYLPAMCPYQGPKPTGSWRVTELEVWGHEKVRCPLGKTKVNQPTGLARQPLLSKYPRSVPDACDTPHTDPSSGTAEKARYVTRGELRKGAPGGTFTIDDVRRRARVEMKRTGLSAEELLRGDRRKQEQEEIEDPAERSRRRAEALRRLAVRRKEAGLPPKRPTKSELRGGALERRNAAMRKAAIGSSDPITRSYAQREGGARARRKLLTHRLDKTRRDLQLNWVGENKDSSKKVDPLAFVARARARDDEKAGHDDAAEYWRGWAAGSFLTSKNGKRKQKKDISTESLRDLAGHLRLERERLGLPRGRNRFHEAETSLKGYETHHSPDGTGPSRGDIGLDGSLPAFEERKAIERKLRRKKLAGV